MGNANSHELCSARNNNISRRRSSEKRHSNPPIIRENNSFCLLDVNALRRNSSAIDDRRKISLTIDQPSLRSRSDSNSSRSPKKRKCMLSIKSKQIIKSCFNNPHDNIGTRILKRSTEKRKDFARFYTGQKPEQRQLMAETIKGLLKKSVTSLDNVNGDFYTFGTEFGRIFVDFRHFGFKADFFTVLAESSIIECVLLDSAVHPAPVTLNAFLKFITALFTAVREGFYAEMRRLRRSSNCFSLSSRSSSHTKLSELECGVYNDRRKQASFTHTIVRSARSQNSKKLSGSSSLALAQKIIIMEEKVCHVQ